MSESLLEDPPAPEYAVRAEWIMFYRQRDEIVFGRHSRLDPSTLAGLCCGARSSFRSLAISAGRHSASNLAARLGLRIAEDEWYAAGGKVLYFAECSLATRVITTNRAVRRRLEEALRKLLCVNLREWLSPELAAESIIAHELYHILMRKPSQPGVELAAHCFARELLGLPFSPLLYAEILRRHSRLEQLTLPA